MRIALVIACGMVFCGVARADVLVGVAGPFSGQNAVLGQLMKAGVEAAVADINSAGGLNGERLSVVAEDDQCDARRAVEIANGFAAQDVRLVVGHFCSTASAAAAQVYAERDVLMISPSASNPLLTEQNSVTTLRVVSRDDTQGALAAERIVKDDPVGVVVVVDDGSPGLKALVARFAVIKAPDLTVSVKPGEKSYRASAEKLAGSNPTSIYLALSGSDAGGFVAAYRAAGGTARIYGPDSLLNETYWEKAKVAGEGTMVSFASDPQSQPEAREVIASQVAKSVTPEGAFIPAYAAVQVYVAATKGNPKLDAAELARILKSGIEFDTVLGPVRFDAKGDVVPQRFTWYRWSQGQFAAEN